MAFNNGLSAFNRRLRRVPVAAREAAKDEVKTAADRITATQKRLAPKESNALSASIRNEPGEHELQRVLKAGGAATKKRVKNGKRAPEIDYAVIQEYGSQDMPANPFFWPGYRLEKKAVLRSMKRRVGKAIKGAFENGK